jgi:uncharacterized protein YjiS (DUF1127 family)
MYKTTNLDSLAILEEAAPRNAIRSTAPVVRLRREPAGNDAHADPEIFNDDIQAWARHADAANGFGDVASIDAAFSAWPSSYALYEEARSHRAVLLGDLIAAGMLAVGAIVRRTYARYQQRREARATYEALRELDDRMLRDLGFARDELISVAAEVTGEVERTRVRALLSQR